MRARAALLAGFALVATSAFNNGFASDLAKEKRWAEQVVDQLFDGEAVWLSADGVRFLSLYTEAASEPKGNVILLHGIGVHPDWPQVINPLRVGLAEQGWNTLSLQLPILPNEAESEAYLPLFPEVPARIDAAILYIHNNQPGPIFFIGHSMGVSMALHYLGGDMKTEISGLVAIGTSCGGEGSFDADASKLKPVRRPVLDLYGENDLVSVLTGVSTRAAVAAGVGNTDFTQTRIDGADHFFEGYEEQLLETVAAWLEARR